MTLVSTRFRAMNTDIVVLTPATGSESEHAFEIVRRVFYGIEACLSRFRPDSELCSLNRSAGKSFQASPLLFAAVSLAVSAAQDTGGIFDPTMLAALEDSGYDKSFDHMSEHPGATDGGARVTQLPDYRCVQCNDRDSTIRLNGNQRIDLGGIGKGFAVDRALAATDFLPDRCISAGGDLAVRGNPADNEVWTVAIEDSGNLGTTSVALRDTALATSSVIKRRWVLNGEERHHLIDSRTGRSSSSSLRSVTAIASTCVQADVGAKTALLLDSEGMHFLDRHGMHGFGVRHDGSTIQTSHWPN